MKKIICFYGGPGVGKSTIAADLFVYMKKKQLNVELVREYVKDWVWEGRQIQGGDQSYIVAKQMRRERILFSKVYYIITDSPIWLGALYERQYEYEPYVCPTMIKKQEKIAKLDWGFEYIHILLERKIEYNPVGRLQTEEDAKSVDKQIKEFFKKEKIKHHILSPQKNVVENIYNDFVV